MLMGDEKWFGATWRRNRKNDVVWEDEDAEVPMRNLQKYQPAIKVGLVISSKGAKMHVLPKWDDVNYAKMVKKTAVPLKKKYPKRKTMVFFQDGDTVHKGELSKKTMRQAGLRFEGDLEFPPNSGDLMLPENCWSIMLTDMENQNTSTKPKLVRATRRAIKKLDPQLLRRMFDGMPARLAECIKRGGERIGK